MRVEGEINMVLKLIQIMKVEHLRYKIKTIHIRDIIYF